MHFQFRPCELEMDHEAYMNFLLQHHNELQLPYSFALKLSFISSPLILGKALLIFNEEPYQIVGAAGFVYGTGANDYEDNHVCQVEIAFLQKDYQGTLLFIHGLLALIDLIKASNPDVQQIQFWASTDNKAIKRIFSKFSNWPGSTQSIVNHMTLYSLSFHELVLYGHRFRKSQNQLHRNEF